MSIYSGFATRNQQQSYDQLLHDLIFTLSKRVLKNYKNQTTDEEKFTKLLKQIFLKLTFLEKQKYLQPNMSEATYHLMEYLIERQNQLQTKKQVKKNSLWVKLKSQDEQQSKTIKNNSTEHKYPNPKLKYSIGRKQQIKNPQSLKKALKKQASSKLQLCPIQQKSYCQKCKSPTHLPSRSTSTNFNIKTHKKRNELSKQSIKVRQIQNKMKSQKKINPFHEEVKDQRMPNVVKQYVAMKNLEYLKNSRKRKNQSIN